MEFVLGTFVEVSLCGNEMHRSSSFSACLAPNSVNDIREPVVPRWYFNAVMLQDKYSQIPRGIFNFPPCFRHVRIFVENDYSLLHHCPSTRNNAARTGRIFMKCDILGFFENVLRKFNFHYSLTKIAGAVQEVLCTYGNISHNSS